MSGSLGSGSSASRSSWAALVGDPIGRVLALARRHLGMEVAFLAEFTGGRQLYRGLDGDAASFGMRVGEGPELAGTYCRRMTEGTLSNAVPDARADPRVRDLPITEQAGVGAYLGVPVRLADGSLYGSFCCVSHGAAPLDERDVRFLELLAELVSEPVQRQRERAAERDRLDRLVAAGPPAIAVQPIVDLANGRLCGVEALSRFPAEYGPPDAVFAAAHAIGLGGALERLAAAAAYDLLPQLGHTAYLAINLTPAVAAALATEASGYPDLDCPRLVLEITEHAAIAEYAALRDRLADLRAQGLRLAIDDAGAGYASLHHVVELAPEIIKVDRSLIDGMAGDRARCAAVAAFTRLAQDMGAVVVAEGVEHPADLAAARDLGVDQAQGYLLARPSLDRGDLARWITAGVHLPTQQAERRRRPAHVG